MHLTELYARQAAETIAFKLSEKALAASEAILRESEERYRVALSSAGMGTWDWHIADNTVIWNEQHYRLLSLQPDQKPQLPETFYRLIHPDDAEMVKDALQAAIDRVGVYSAEFRIIRADNDQVLWMNGYGSITGKEQGKPVRMIGVMYDITAHKLLEKQKDEFLGIASHELKTPVTGIKAYAELLLSMFQETGRPEYVSLMQKLDSQVDRLTDLIRALLDATRISEGQLPLYLESFDLNILIAGYVEDLQRLSKLHPLVFEPGALLPLMADKERIGQVITNLISNAVKYTPDGGTISIRSGTTDDGDGVVVSVQDTGIGIPDDMQSKVFDRFFRVGYTQTNTFPGMGLGLYISAGIVQRHGGAIAVESIPGEGSRFYFTLPYAGHA